MTEAEARALFLLAGIEIQSMHELANKYWPDVPDYAEYRRASPWWLVKTPSGLIEIGWRKRVISIDWTDTKVKWTIPKEDEWVTHDEMRTHAHGYVKALEYLTLLSRELRALAPPSRNGGASG